MAGYARGPRLTHTHARERARAHAHAHAHSTRTHTRTQRRAVRNGRWPRCCRAASKWRGLGPCRVENNHRARRRTFGPHFWTSLLDLTAAAGAGWRLPICNVKWPLSVWSWCTEGGPQSHNFEKKIHLEKPEPADLQPKTLRNWTSPSGAVHFFGPHSLSPFGPHWNLQKSTLYKSRCACPNWTSLLRVKNSF